MSPATDSPRAVVLLSGGLDSATTAAIARSEGFAAYALSFRYGQRHAGKSKRPRRVAAAVGAAEHVVADIDLRAFGGSALTDGLPGPAGTGRSSRSARDPHDLRTRPQHDLPVVSRSAGPRCWGRATSSSASTPLDYSGYPDCRPEFIEAFERMANLATRAGVEGRRPLPIHAPLIQLSKAEIIRGARPRAWITA